MRFKPLLVLASVLAGCESGAGPSPTLDQSDLPATVTLAEGETLRVGGLAIRFNGVSSDSRCPIDVVCVWAGNAELGFAVGPTAGDGPAQLLTLNTGLEPRSGSALGLSVSVLTLSPAPVSDRPTENYRVEIRIGLAP